MCRLLFALLLSACLWGQQEVYPAGSLDPASIAVPVPSLWLPAWVPWCPDFEYRIDPVPPDSWIYLQYVPSVFSYLPVNGYTYIYGMVSGGGPYVSTAVGDWIGTEPYVLWVIPPLVPYPTPTSPSYLSPWSVEPVNPFGEGVAVNATIGGQTLFQILPPGTTFTFQTLWLIPDQYGGYAASLSYPIIAST